MNIDNAYFDRSIISDSIENPMDQLELIITDVLNNMDETYTIDKMQALKALQLINFFCDAHDIVKMDVSDISRHSNEDEFKNIISDFLESIIMDAHLYYANPFMKKKYELTDKEHDTIQELLNKLRDKVDSIESGLDEDHKRRVLKKINEMQTELNKKMSTFDSMIGKSYDVIKVLGFGRREVVTPVIQDATKLMKEMNKVEAKHSGLPDVSNQFEHKEETEDIIDIEVNEQLKINK